jgi:hypothetical protein
MFFGVDQAFSLFPGILFSAGKSATASQNVRITDRMCGCKPFMALSEKAWDNTRLFLACRFLSIALWVLQASFVAGNAE